MIVRSAVVFVLLALLGYGFLKLWPLLSGPVLTIEIPKDHTTYADGFIPVSGKSTHTEAVSLNDAPLLIDQQGRFETVLVLPPGGGILELTATDRFGRSVTRYRTVFVPNTTNDYGTEEEKES